MPEPVVGWDAPESDWRHARRSGLGASEVAAALGLSRWQTPWEVWAGKTGVRRRDTSTDAAELGVALEPWLLAQAAVLLGVPVERTPARLYAHGDHPWRLASPDGATKAGGLVECKTAGLTSGRADPDDWDGRVPLVYEIQARWQMHVMDVDVVHVVALVAGMGLLTRTVDRDPAIEAELVRQTAEWWHRHVVDGVEPPIGAGDLAALADLWPTPDGGTVDLDDTDAAELLGLRRRAAARRDQAAAEVDDIDAQLRRLIGPHGEAYLSGRLAYSLPTRRGSVDWRAYADAVAADPTTHHDPETFRRPPTRRLVISKEWQ